ncbi:hypothetical protein OBBRIDRAFT_827513 [Obba rivulosa]|uniref:Uncharacterized protein n=1 Tax=Obba rivulosa TaxID=1052685 RepID=A0A8E2DMB1_9APHY|nr:hypothetical protein OBBRIDRAFT_827513 [Obba rivulosa]
MSIKLDSYYVHIPSPLQHEQWRSFGRDDIENDDDYFDHTPSDVCRDVYACLRLIFLMCFPEFCNWNILPGPLPTFSTETEDRPTLTSDSRLQLSQRCFDIIKRSWALRDYQVGIMPDHCVPDLFSRSDTLTTQKTSILPLFMFRSPSQLLQSEVGIANVVGDMKHAPSCKVLRTCITRRLEPVLSLLVALHYQKHGWSMDRKLTESDTRATLDERYFVYSVFYDEGQLSVYACYPDLKNAGGEYRWFVRIQRLLTYEISRTLRYSDRSAIMTTMLFVQKQCSNIQSIIEASGL